MGFMGRISLVALALLAGGLARPAVARALEIGIAAPLSGNFAVLGQQIEAGARVAAKGRDDVALSIAGTDCTAESGKEAAEKLVAEKVGIVVGFVCTEAIEAAMPIFKAAGIPVVTPAVRTGSLTDRRDRTGWPVFRLAPRDDAEEKAVAKIMTERWRDELFAIIDDGTIYGRLLAENFRAAAELAGLKPVYVDTYRPQLDNQIGLVGRLRRAGATHVFVGGDRADIAVIVRDAEKLGYSITVAGGEALRAEGGAVPLEAGVLMVGLPRWAGIAEAGALKALADEAVQPEGYVLPAYAAMQVAMQAAEAAAGEGAPVSKALADGDFSTALGSVHFDANGDLDRSFYRLFRYDGTRFVEVK
jgi:branched-chain amino acid transport system substrate-binding protein